MRTLILLAASLPVCLFADEPKVLAHISADDVHQISTLVLELTKDSIRSVSGVPADGPGPETVPVECFDVSKGTMQPKTCYERTDLVDVLTSDGKRFSEHFKVQKLPKGWKVIGRKPAKMYVE